MEVRYGKGTTEFGPGVSIKMTGDEVAMAIDSWLFEHGVQVSGPRTITVNGSLCSEGHVYVDPSGYVAAFDVIFPGRGPDED